MSSFGPFWPGESHNSDTFNRLPIRGSNGGKCDARDAAGFSGVAIEGKQEQGHLGNGLFIWYILDPPFNFPYGQQFLMGGWIVSQAPRTFCIERQLL